MTGSLSQTRGRPEPGLCPKCGRTRSFSEMTNLPSLCLECDTAGSDNSIVTLLVVVGAMTVVVALALWVGL